MVTEAMLAYQAKQSALETWDKGDREAAADTFLRQLAGERDSRGIYKRCLPVLLAPCRTNDRGRFESICDSIAAQCLYGA